MTPLQRRVLGFLATVDSATPRDVADATDRDRRRAAEVAARLIAKGHVTDTCPTSRHVYRITLQGRQAIAPPLVCVAWRNGQSAPLKPATAEALRVRLDGEMGPGTHRIVPA